MRTLRLTMLACMAGLVVAAPSWADATAELNVQDDRITEGDVPNAQAIINGWRSTYGIDSVRITAFWDRIETSPGVYNFNAPGYSLDQAVSRVRAAGLEPVITLAEKGPVSASQQPGRNDGTFMPDPAKYGRFAAAVAGRYAGSVYKYTIGNEPNQGTFLTPQRVGGKPFSPHWYRKLAQAAYPAIKAHDGSSLVIIGVNAPIGGVVPSAPSVAPLKWMRELACVDDKLKPMTTGYCAGFRPARGDAYAQHPYTIRFRLPPTGHMPVDNVGTGDWPRFFKQIDSLTHRGRILAPGGRFNIYVTEYGYETNPPDSKFGFSQATQSRYLQQAAYIEWRTPRVKMQNQYLWWDDANFFKNGSNITFQTGVAFTNGSPKLAQAAFPHPFYINIKRPYSMSRAQVWGQVRPGGAASVQIQYSAGCSAYSTVATASTNFRGYFSRTMAVKPGCYRFVGGGQTSDAIHPGS